MFSDCRCTAAARGIARAAARRSTLYLQNTIIIGAGDVGQLVARKLLQHREYGLNLVGFVDERPKELRTDLAHLAVLGGPERLAELIEVLDVERVIVAFSAAPEREDAEDPDAEGGEGPDRYLATMQGFLDYRFEDLLGPNLR